MIRSSPNTIRRAAAVVLAAAVLPFLATHASAQMLDLFAGSPGTTTLTTAFGGTSSGAFGPGYTGSVSLVVSVNSTQTENFTANPFNVPGSNSLNINFTGLVGAGGTAVATKNFGTALAANTTYSFTLTSSTAAAVNALGGFGVTLYNNTTGTGTPFAGAGTNTGLIGAANLLNQFNSGSTATFSFTTPTTYVPTNGLTVSFTTNELAAASNSNVTFTGASIAPVPEPHTVVATLLGASGLAVLRFRRRLRGE